MKKFLFMFLLAAAVAGAFTFALAEEPTQGEEEKKFVIHGEVRQRADFIDNFTISTSDYLRLRPVLPLPGEDRRRGALQQERDRLCRVPVLRRVGRRAAGQGRTSRHVTCPNVDQNTSSNLAYNTEHHPALSGLDRPEQHRRGASSP